MLTLKRIESFLEYVSSWKWIEDDPDECCDMLRFFLLRSGKRYGCFYGFSFHCRTSITYSYISFYIPREQSRIFS